MDPPKVLDGLAGAPRFHYMCLGIPVQLAVAKVSLSMEWEMLVQLFQVTPNQHRRSSVYQWAADEPWLAKHERDELGVV